MDYCKHCTHTQPYTHQIFPLFKEINADDNSSENLKKWLMETKLHLIPKLNNIRANWTKCMKIGTDTHIDKIYLKVGHYFSDVLNFVVFFSFASA